ncbi:MAG: hypothetical protein ACFFAN_19410 [Promethearchaeota archaeon]
MSEEKNTLKVIDETIKAVENISGVLRTAKQELINLENDKISLSNEKAKLEREKERLEREKNQLENETLLLEKEQTKLKMEKEQLESEKQERDLKIGALTKEQMKLLDEYQSLKVELKKLSSIAAEHDEAEYNFERIKALLSIYVVLLEEIWQGQPHFRILYTLHGDREEMTREEIKNTTGITGAMVLRAIHELDGANIVSYDVNTRKVKLLRRIFEKKALK